MPASCLSYWGRSTPLVRYCMCDTVGQLVELLQPHSANDPTYILTSGTSFVEFAWSACDRPGFGHLAIRPIECCSTLPVNHA